MRRADLPSLTIFAEIAGQGSFRAAARSLGLSVSAVSHALSNLEASLNVRLIARTTRSVALTEAGSRLLAQLKPALESIGEAVENASASQDRLAGTIRITVPRAAAEMLLVPLAIRFMQHHPAVVIEIVVQDGFEDIVASGFDAGVRLGESLHQDMIAVPLGPQQRGALVASPAYFTGRQKPSMPSDLHDHECILRRFAGGGIYRWEFVRDGKETELAVVGALVLNDDSLIVQAALAGAGIAYVFEGLVSAHIAEGRLVRGLEQWCPPFLGFYFYYPTRQLMRPAMRAFVDFIKLRNAA